jgi:hypothetical protein
MIICRSFFPVGNGPEFGTNFHSEEDRISGESSPSEAEEDEMEGPFAFRRQPNVQVKFQCKKPHFWGHDKVITITK